MIHPVNHSMRLAFLVAAMAGLFLCTQSIHAGDDLYVSNDGNDTWSGTIATPNSDGTDGPFASLVQARDAIRQRNAAGRLHQSITVHVRGGTYSLSEPLRFTAEDSGPPGQLITYRAFENEKPVLSGGTALVDWHPYRDKIWKCALPEPVNGVTQARQLFYEGERQVRARTPNLDPTNPRYGGWAYIEKPMEGAEASAFVYDSGTIFHDWKNPGQAEVFIFPWLCWNNDIVPIHEVDSATRTIKLARPIIYHDTGEHEGLPTVDFMSIMPGNRFYVENLLEELDQPGEWCLDAETRTVYFWPKTGSPNSTEVILPAIGRLIELRGEAAAPIRNLRITGFIFRHTLSGFPRVRQAHNYPNAGGHAVLFENAQDCSVDNNFFDAVGGDAVRMEGFNARNRIVGNEIAHVGASGICLCGSTDELFPSGNLDRPEQLKWDVLVRERPKFIRNVISRNHIRHTGIFERRGSGVYVFGTNSVDNVISHNLIHDTPARGIMIQHGFGRNIVEYNDVQRVSLETADTGGINTLVWYVYEPDPDLARGNIIRFNLVRDVIGAAAYESAASKFGGHTGSGRRIVTPYYCWGIYLDWDPVDTLVYGNIVVGNELGGIMMLRHARNNVFENNILVDSRRNQIWYRSMSGGSYGNRFLRNIVYYSRPAAGLIGIGRLPGKRIDQSDYNLFFHANGEPLVVDLPDVAPEDSFAKWRELGFDRHSVVADPLFVNPRKGDYRLRPDSPAYELGFRPIDVSRIGMPDHVCPVEDGRGRRRKESGDAEVR